jgi:hypothetical protein
MKRRDVLAGAAAAVLPLPAIAQGKPDKLVYVGDNGPPASRSILLCCRSIPGAPA